MEFGRTTFFIFDLLVALSFELGDHFEIHAAICQLILIAVVVECVPSYTHSIRRSIAVYNLRIGFPRRFIEKSDIPGW